MISTLYNSLLSFQITFNIFISKYIIYLFTLLPINRSVYAFHSVICIWPYIYMFVYMYYCFCVYDTFHFSSTPTSASTSTRLIACHFHYLCLFVATFACLCSDSGEWRRLSSWLPSLWIIRKGQYLLTKPHIYEYAGYFAGNAVTQPHAKTSDYITTNNHI